MANLVLKPSTGAGNSVIIKDQGGGSVLTTADSGILKLGMTATSKPSSPVAGEIYFNSALKALCFWDGAMWRIISGGPSGGQIHDYLLSGVSYRSHTFLDVGVSGFYLPSTTTLDVLMVGGGGSGGHGGNNYGGGGGAGGMIIRPARSTAAGTYDIVIGAGGIAPFGVSKNLSAYNTKGSGLSGYNSTAFGMTALGGGFGGYNSTGGGAGGSGGGTGNHSDTSAAPAGVQTTDSSISAESKTYGFGNAGGNTLASGTGSTGKAGSGGGAGSVGNFYRGEEYVPASGQEHYDRGMVGGDGKVNNYRTGVDIWYACGGGSAGWSAGDKSTVGGTYTIQSGIGGYGSLYPSSCGSMLDTRTIGGVRARAAAQPGTPNTGNGGGGGANNYYDTPGGRSAGGDGGSGIIVIRYVV